MGKKSTWIEFKQILTDNKIMDDQNILKIIQNVEEKLLYRFSELNNLLSEIKNTNKYLQLNSDRVFAQKLTIPALNICLDTNLYHKLIEDCENFFPSRLADFRAKLLEEKGFLIPSFEINHLESLETNGFIIFIRNDPVYKGKLENIVNDPWSIIIYELYDLMFQNSDKIISRDTVWLLLNNFNETDKTLIDELKAKSISISTIRQVLVNLLKEKISIKDIKLILQRILEFNVNDASSEIISEKIRKDLIYSLTNKYIINDESMNVLLLSEDMENAISDSIQNPNSNPHQDIIGQIVFESLLEFSHVNFTVLANPLNRRQLYKIMEKFEPNITILATDEINNEININIIGTIDLVKCYNLDNIELYEGTIIEESYLNDLIDFEDDDYKDI